MIIENTNMKKQSPKEINTKTWDLLLVYVSENKSVNNSELASELKISLDTLDEELDLIRDYCTKNNIPRLTLVVNDRISRAMQNLPPGFGNKSVQELAKVYEFNWSEIKNPFK